MSVATLQRCTHPELHIEGRAALVAAGAEVCRQRGARLTRMRERVLSSVIASPAPVKAYELLARLRDEGARAPTTIYRALDFLLTQGLIHRLESINAYVGCHHPELNHSVPFLICMECQRAIELEDEAITHRLAERAAALGFETAKQTLEVRGTCARCRTGA